MDRAPSGLVRPLSFPHIFKNSKIDYSLVRQHGGFKNVTFQLVSKQMGIGMKAAGEMARRTAMESSTILTKARFMKAFGWMEWQSVGPCQILGGMKHQHRQSIRFHRYIFTVDTFTSAL